MPPRGGWRQDHADFAFWLNQPSDTEMGGKGKGLRRPATVVAYAQEHNIPLRSLYDWMDYPDWPDLMAECAKESFLNLDPEFFKNWAISLLKPDPNDRLVTAWIRYGRPALLREKEQGQWNIIQSLNATSQKSDRVYVNTVREIRELPLEQRELFLDILERAQRTAEMEMLDDDSAPTRKPIKKVNLGEELVSTPPAPAQAVEQPTNLRLLPPAGTSDTTGYNPRLRKPLRKPRH